MTMYAKVEAGGKFVLKGHGEGPHPTWTPLTAEQEEAVRKILKDPAKALGVRGKAQRAEIAEKYAKACERVLAGKRHGFRRGNKLVPLLREAAGMPAGVGNRRSEYKKARGARKRQRQQQQQPQVVNASMSVEEQLRQLAHQLGYHMV